MNQIEDKESLIRSLEEEAIDVECLLVEPPTDQVSVDGVLSFHDENPKKLMKIEDVPYRFDSDATMDGADISEVNVVGAFSHEVGVEKLLAANDASTCEDYLLDIGFAETVADVDYCPSGELHLRNSVSESRIPDFSGGNNGNFGLPSLLTEIIPESDRPINVFGKTNCDLHGHCHCNCGSVKSVEPKCSKFLTSPEKQSVVKLENIPISLIKGHSPNENEKDIKLSPHSMLDGISCSSRSSGYNEIKQVFQGVYMESNHADVPKSSDHDYSNGALSQKRLRKPTRRYIDESSDLSRKNRIKRQDSSSSSKDKILGIRRRKHGQKMGSKARMDSSEKSFDKAIQVPFDYQAVSESLAKHTSIEVTNAYAEPFSAGYEDDSETTIGSMGGGSQRKLHRLWTLSEVKKLIDGVSHFGVGKWTHIKKLLFSTSVHRTPVDLKDKWRNLLKASCAVKQSKSEDEQKRNQPWRPLPKSMLCRVRELATVYPYPRESKSKNSKSNLVHVRHVSSPNFPARIKGNPAPFR